MGLLDSKVFESVAKDKYSKEEATTKAGELLSLCRGYIEDPDWHPFKVISERGLFKVCMSNTFVYYLYVLSFFCTSLHSYLIINP